MGINYSKNSNNLKLENLSFNINELRIETLNLSSDSTANEAIEGISKALKKTKTVIADSSGIPDAVTLPEKPVFFDGTSMPKRSDNVKPKTCIRSHSAPEGSSNLQKVEGPNTISVIARDQLERYEKIKLELNLENKQVQLFTTKKDEQVNLLNLAQVSRIRKKI